MKRILLFVLLSFLVAAPDLPAATGPAGNMVLNKGTVKIRRAGIDTLFQQTGQTIPVFDQDEIQTGAEAGVSITLTARDDTIELFSQSFFKIENTAGEATETTMAIGKARFQIKRDLQPRPEAGTRFRVRTANAVVGVKGTEFVLGTGAEVTSILTLEGSVDVASLAAPDIVVEVGENQVSQVLQASTPTAPVEVPPSVRDNILTTDSPDAFNTVTFGDAVPDTASADQDQPKEASDEDDKEEDAEEKPAEEGEEDGSAEADATDEGDPETLGEDDSPSETADLFADDDAIDLEMIDADEMAEFDLEEPEFDLDTLFDIDAITEEITETTTRIAEEIETIQEELVETATERTIEIRITHE